MVEVGAVLAARDPDGLRRALRQAHRTAGAAAVEEVLLQSYLFLGYPLALNAFGVWREVSGEPAPGPTADRPERWPERGREVFRAVYGEQADNVRRNVADLHPDLERWMLEEGYGKVLGRPGLSLVERELVIVALLAVSDVPVQLHSHLRGALRNGAGAAVVEAVLSVAGVHSTDDARRSADETWARVRGGRGGTEASARTERPSDIG